MRLYLANKKKIEKEYYENGNLKKECEIYIEQDSMYCIEIQKDSSIVKTGYKNKNLNGIQEVFYPSGIRKAFGYFINGKQNGYFSTYHPNSLISQMGYLYNDTLVGEVKIFDKDGKLVERQFYANFYKKENNKCWVEYDSLGQITYETRRVDVLPFNDTINSNTLLTLELRLPKFDSTYFLIGDFDHRFFLKDSTSIDTIFSVNHKASINK